MIVLAWAALAVAVFVISWSDISARLDRDLPLLTDAGQDCAAHGHDWRHEPGTPDDECGRCGAFRVAIPIGCTRYGHSWRAQGAVWRCCICGHRTPRNALTYRDETNA